MTWHKFWRALRSCHLFFTYGAVMAKLDSITAAVDNLAAKVTAHLDADGIAVAAMLAQNAALQTQVADLTAQLAATGTSDAEIAAVVASIDGISAKL